MESEYARKLFDLANRIKALCQERGEITLVEIECLALTEGIRATSIFDIIAISYDFKVDLSGGKVISL